MPLEPQHAVAQNARFGQVPADFAGDRAQIFADHEKLSAHAFERENPEQILGVVAHVGALRGRHSVRNPLQAEEAHHVIDAQRSAVARVLANRLREKLIAVGAVRRRDRAAESPSPGPAGEKSSGGAPTRQPAA